MSNSSTANAHDKLIQKLLDNLPSGYTAASVKLPNRSFNTPSNTKWLRTTVLNQDVNNVQAGGGWKRYDGLFVIDLFYPVGNDVIAQLTEAEAIVVFFENLSFDQVNCYEALITDEGKSGSWYQVQISIDFYYEGT